VKKDAEHNVVMAVAAGQDSIVKNIPTNLANFLHHHNSILLKSIGFSCGNTRNFIMQ
jgi:hypothetical protein